MATRVVVVDDDREIREALRDALQDAGYEVFIVPNGLRLLSVLSVARPDVILLDVMMSWIDGFGLCEALKQNPRFCEIPVVFMSARTGMDDIRRGLACDPSGLPGGVPATSASAPPRWASKKASTRRRYSPLARWNAWLCLAPSTIHSSFGPRARSNSAWAISGLM